MLKSSADENLPTEQYVIWQDTSSLVNSFPSLRGVIIVCPTRLTVRETLMYFPLGLA